MAQEALACRARFLGHALTAGIAHGSDDFKALQFQFLEAELRTQPRGGQRYSAARAAGPYPVAQIGEVVNRIDLIDADRAQELSGRFIVSDEVVSGVLLPVRDRGRHPLLAVFGRWT